MSVSRRISSQRERFGANGPELSAVTDGEINFLWSFIQGSIMVPQTRGTLLRGYGFCERHAWIHISVEMSFRDQYLLGPTILYSELIEKSLRAIAPERIGLHLLMRRLAAGGPCLLCALHVKNASAGACPQARLDRGRDGSRLRDFAGKLQSIWRSSLCPDCSGQDRGRMAPGRCRQHLLAAIKARTPVDLVAQKAMLEDLSDRVARYERSFSAGGPKASDRDRAALIAAIGWCSGWRPLLAQFPLSGVA